MTQVERIPVSDFIDELLAHKERTGIGETALLGGCRNEKPPGLKASIVQSWFNGQVTTAKKDYAEFVLQRWRKVPDNARPRRGGIIPYISSKNP